MQIADSTRRDMVDGAQVDTAIENLRSRRPAGYGRRKPTTVCAMS